MFLAKDNKIKWKFLAIAAIAVACVCAGGIFWFDQPLFLSLRWLYGYWCKVIDVAGSFKSWVIASVVIFAISYAIAKMTKSRKFWSHVSSAAFYVFCSVVLSGAVAGVLKILFGRLRPVMWEALGQTGFYPFNTEWVFNSFPSGHAAASFAGLVMIGLLFPRAKPVTWTVAILAGLSRVCAGAHWPSDVLLGAFIGMTAADVARSFITRRLIVKN